MSTFFRVTRRDFLQTVGLSAGALVFGTFLSREEAAAAGIKDVLHNYVPLGPYLAIEPLDGTIVILTFRPEMGQGTRSTLAAVLADELEADWSRVKLKLPDTDSVGFAVPFPFDYPEDVTLPFPYDELKGKPKPYYLNPPEASQFADSSRSITACFTTMRLTGAGVRLVFERAAAKVFHADASECHARQHKVVHDPTGRSLDFRDPLLLFEAGKVPVPGFEEVRAAAKDPSKWRFIGKSMPFADAPDIVTGKAVYCADYDVPGMLTAMVERCPVANGKIASFDPAPALAVPGVRAVMRTLPKGWPPGGVGAGFTPHDGIAVIADNTWAAWRGRRELRPTIQWDLKDNVHASYDSVAFQKELADNTSKPGKLVRRKGDVDAAFGQAAKVVDATYWIPHLAQTPMEPLVAIALLKDGHLEVWSSTQNPNSSQLFAGYAAFGVSPADWGKPDVDADMCKKVTQHVPLLGGGFGRKSQVDYVAEAASLAAQNPGVPIRVQWTREDDVRFSYYNSASSQYLKAALDAEGRPTALLQRSALTSFFATLFSEDQAKVRASSYNGGEYPYASAIERAQGLEDMPFDVPNLRIENCKAPSHIRAGWMRSVANVYHAFGICSFGDEMANAAGRDSKDYLLELIGAGRILPLASEEVKQYRNNELPLVNIPVLDPAKPPLIPGFPPDTRRLHAVIKRVAKESNWDAKVKQYKGTKRGLGIAAHRSFLSYVAIVADVSLNDANELTVNEIWGAIDCGLAVNPDRVRAQMEGGINYGLSYGLLGEISCKDGAVEQHNFDDYPVLRIYQAPKKINVYIMESDQPPSGAGEPPTPAVAPAVANAIVAAGGPRIRAIPFYKNGIKVP
jgi:isoquinoline 1-oxidoreductase beta subunit